MRDVAGLMHLAFKLAHEISDASLDMEVAPGLRAHRGLGGRIADCGVSALAHVAAASVTYSGGYRDRLDACNSLRGARECLKRLGELLRTVSGQRYMEGPAVLRLSVQTEQASALYLALIVELKGGVRAA